ncbi:hypothetical protein Tsubulata_033544 [Turnera subulata]|uniref:Protein OBERON 3 n=1 Tax=Turnera subulata TaxID=218843 RepID=A0A9Q0GJW7_9ROSI|nr:hypothetical protein Tsubulata_033544 [Turnera subulata]
MFGEKDHHHLSRGDAESSRNKQENPPPERKGIEFLGDSSMGVNGFVSKPQELTLSYLCENPPRLAKRKEVIFSGDSSNQDEKWVERDFLNLSETKSSSSSKRGAHQDEKQSEEGAGEEQQGEGGGGAETGRDHNNSSKEKKQKLEGILNLSLALPDVSLSLTASNALQNGGDPVLKPRPARSLQSLGGAPSFNDKTQTTCSNDFTAASLSYSYSHPFSHNPSCSMTRNSTENYDYSVGRDDQIWCGGEGTNGSVHSRFRPIGDGIVALNNNNNNNLGSGLSVMQGTNRTTNQDSCNNSLYKTTSSDNVSFFPSELPAKPRMDAFSGDSRRKDSENLRGLDSGDGGGRAKKISTPGRLVREIVLESVPVVAQIIQELTEETLQSTREYLKNLILLPEHRDELVALQNRLERRSDLSKEALSKCRKEQLEILVAVKMGLSSFISGKVHLPANELVEIFLFMRCRNVSCKSVLPVDDCECKFCSGNKGFCSSCMCPICMNFDCANNTCSWVGCDVCSHWCHAACGLQKNLIRPGPTLKGPSGTSEMQFHCWCGHASEMFGFVKDVFAFCAKSWAAETLIKELDCVRKIFRGSEDFKGKELHMKAEDLLFKLERKVMSPSDACSIIIQFFNYILLDMNSSPLHWSENQSGPLCCFIMKPVCEAQDPAAFLLHLPLSPVHLFNYFYLESANLTYDQIAFKGSYACSLTESTSCLGLGFGFLSERRGNLDCGMLYTNWIRSLLDADSVPDFAVSGLSAKELMPTETSLRKETASIPPSTSLLPKYTIYNNTSSSSGRRESVSNDHRNDLKAALLGDIKMEDEFQQFGKISKKDGFENIESVVRIKEAEFRMFQNKADEARREAEGFRRMIRVKSEKLEEEYAEKLAKLCLQETEDRRRKKLEELKMLENSHCDYYNMKLRMQAEIAGLLERMEATKQQWV